MTFNAEMRKEIGEQYWRPGFVDYLFIAFNTSTVFSPTDYSLSHGFRDRPLMGSS